jgi:tRNA dimethylallyltransferase
MRKKVYIILGPTCSGKTSLAINISKKLNAEILSADSRQIYKHMDIGTGKKPVNSEVIPVVKDKCWVMDEVTIWGYDLINPDQFFSAYDFASNALNNVVDIFSRGKNVIIVGGTGFYIDVLTGRVRPSNTLPNFELRNDLELLSLSELQQKLLALNKEEYKRIDTNNKVRLMRAIEKNISTEVNPVALPYLDQVDYVYIGLTASREILYSRADLWVESIWKNGLVEETKKLIDMGYKSSPKLQGLVYKSVISYIDGLLSEAEAIQRIKFDMHAYIRRQQTYFKKMRDINWFDISQDGTAENVYNFMVKEKD